MKAAIRKKYGPPSVIQIATLPRPTPNNKEVLIKIHATTVNRTDCGVLTGLPYIFRFFIGLFRPKIETLGTDFSGEIVAVGNDVQNFKIGDKVFGFNDEGLGSQAEYLVYPANGNILEMPKNTSYEVAVASLEGAHYAINFMNKVELKPGQKVLLNGATGGIGSAALQLLKYKNLFVTAVCNTKNIDLIKSLGADKIFNYETEDFTKDTERYDFIFDAVGKSSFGKCKPLMQPKSIYISSELGPRNENPFLALLAPFMGGKKVRFPIPDDVKASMTFIKELLETGNFQPIIDRYYPFADIAEAYEYVAAGKKTGNVVIRVHI